MAKDKKKKDKKKNKLVAAGKKSGKSKPRKAASRLKALTENPLVADIVASALVATAAALKDPNKARRLAAQSGDELSALAKEGADRGSAMWQLAMEVGRRSLEAFASEVAPKPRKPKARAAKKSRG